MTESEATIREEPGEYRISAVYREDGTFLVKGETSEPVTLTVRVEDVWERIAPELRRYSYRAEVRCDKAEEARVLEDVAPDARIFLEFAKTFVMEFT